MPPVLLDLPLADLRLAHRIAEGLTARDISRLPGSPYHSTESARKAVEALLARTGARTRAQLAGWMAAQHLVTGPARPAGAPAELPPRIRQILAGWAAGRTTQDLADELGASDASMHAYTGTLFIHLRVANPAQAVVVGVHTGLITVHTGTPTSDAQEAPTAP